MRTVGAWFCQRTPVLAHLVLAKAVYVGLPFANELLRVLVNLVEVVRRVELAIAPIEAKPVDILTL